MQVITVNFYITAMRARTSRWPLLAAAVVALLALIGVITVRCQADPNNVVAAPQALLPGGMMELLLGDTPEQQQQGLDEARTDLQVMQEPWPGGMQADEGEGGVDGEGANAEPETAEDRRRRRNRERNRAYRARRREAGQVQPAQAAEDRARDTQRHRHARAARTEEEVRLLPACISR